MEKRVFRMFRKSLFTNPGWRPLEITFPQKFLISPRAGRFFLIAIIALACLTPNGSYGAPVSYNYLFSGTMTSESTAIDGPTLCSPGDPFTGVMKYTYDPDAQPVSGYYNSPDDYSEVYANALEYSIKFNGISVYNSTDVHVGPQSLFGYGMGVSELIRMIRRYPARKPT